MVRQFVKHAVMTRREDGVVVNRNRDRLSLTLEMEVFVVQGRTSLQHCTSHRCIRDTCIRATEVKSCKINDFRMQKNY